ncbi:DUF1338 domain-containing protein [Aliikangiella coralliicola]|uniref:2-oxoadipate dioxygenase/decarboxylase n=1 Tax=Aliikangiella coralliicola TaxID=2592383 RepID=A0A545U7Q7_9GAMM|nr:DUF1338 domain-containing protein [Aliikangiella coralliicola]TQV85510.1 DUF1338 domain-containing protein [Aliikangiella coralliicola]
MNTPTQSIEQIFENMWNDYLALNPDALKIFNLFNQKDTVVNDHVAFRTFGLPGLRVEDIASPLIEAGYKEVESYNFEKKKLRAKHYAHPSMPLVFISELKIEEFSDEAQTLIKQLASQVDLNSVKAQSFLYSGRPWSVSSEVYERLLEESEYAAWVAAFGYRPNHFTVSINDLTQFQSIQQVNQFVKDNGFALNVSGGEVKGTPESFLEQSSTMANSVEVKFSDISKTIPSCFYEFALRHPMANGELFKGFIASSADKIFESTNSKAA